MCARFTLTNRLNRVVQKMVELMLNHAPDWDQGPRYNISRTQQVAAVRGHPAAVQPHVGNARVALPSHMGG
jgi:putative SOS response-associated peptidase YedK